MSVADKLGFGPKREVVSNGDGTFAVTVTPSPVFIKNPKPQTVKLSECQFRRYEIWRGTGQVIQEVLFDLSPEDREILQSGLGPDEDVWKEEDDCTELNEDTNHFKCKEN